MKHLSAALISLSPAALWLLGVVYKEEMQLWVNLSHGLQGQTPPSTPCCLHPVPGPTVPQIVPSVMLTAQVIVFLLMVNNLCDLFSFCILTLESLHSYQIQLNFFFFFFLLKWRNMLFCISSISSPLCLCTLTFFFPLILFPPPRFLSRKVLGVQDQLAPRAHWTKQAVEDQSQQLTAATPPSWLN